MTLTQLHYAVVLSESESMHDAARKLFISQPSLSASIRDLETELGFRLFTRSARGIRITPEGEEFIGYARQIEDEMALINARFIDKTTVRKKFSVSMQHYSFAVEAFVHLVRAHHMEGYDLSVRESRTREVIDDVRGLRSEIGVLYINDFNKKVMTKVFTDAALTFEPLFDTGISVYMSSSHPLAAKKIIRLEDLQDYPFLAFDQGVENSFYYAEEVLSTYSYRQIIHANDRASMQNLMTGLNGYTLCSGIVGNEFGDPAFTILPLRSHERMTIGCIHRKGVPPSSLAEEYIDLLRQYRSDAEKTLHNGD